MDGMDGAGGEQGFVAVNDGRDVDEPAGQKAREGYQKPKREPRRTDDGDLRKSEQYIYWSTISTNPIHPSVARCLSIFCTPVGIPYRILDTRNLFYKVWLNLS
jgi:hypothetical protein